MWTLSRAWLSARPSMVSEMSPSSMRMPPMVELCATPTCTAHCNPHPAAAQLLTPHSWLLATIAISPAHRVPWLLAESLTHTK